jgi:hypothetical protein
MTLPYESPAWTSETLHGLTTRRTSTRNFALVLVHFHLLLVLLASLKHVHRCSQVGLLALRTREAEGIHELLLKHTHK